MVRVDKRLSKLKQSCIDMEAPISIIKAAIERMSSREP